MTKPKRYKFHVRTSEDGPPFRALCGVYLPQKKWTTTHIKKVSCKNCRAMYRQRQGKDLDVILPFSYRRGDIPLYQARQSWKKRGVPEPKPNVKMKAWPEAYWPVRIRRGAGPGRPRKADLQPHQDRRMPPEEFKADKGAVARRALEQEPRRQARETELKPARATERRAKPKAEAEARVLSPGGQAAFEKAEKVASEAARKEAVVRRIDEAEPEARDQEVARARAAAEEALGGRLPEAGKRQRRKQRQDD